MTFKFRPGDRVTAPDEPESVVIATKEIKSRPHYLLAIDDHTWFPERLLSPALREIEFSGW
jgi:hypothetical protein